MKPNLKHPTATLTKSEKQNLKAFARACGVNLMMALQIRDDLLLVGLELPKLGKSRR